MGVATVAQRAAATDAGAESATPGIESAGPAPARFGYRPGLDGLRALALLAVMAFHGAVPEARGGYLGVSAFFTLSGFLIATLAIDERRATGRLSWRAFWERRVRRLLPAAVVAAGAVLVLQAWKHVGSGPRFRGDVLAALGYASNWRQATAPGGYASIFSSPSPVVHFWSLAIEEQFYVLFPLVFAAVMALGGGRGRRGAVVFGTAALASFAVAWVSADLAGNDGITYYGTHTRAGELLVGVALAYVLAAGRTGQSDRTGPSRSPDPTRARRLRTVGAALAGAAALAGLAVLWSRVAIGDPRLFHGVTALNAALTAVVIAAAVAAGPLDRALGVAPLRAVGKVSYGAYLLHWPIFLVLTAERTGLDGAPLFGVRLAATLVAAAVSYVAIEAPFRFRLRMPRPRLAALGAGAVAAVACLVLALPQHQAPFADLAAASPGGGPGAPTADAASAGEPGGGMLANLRVVGAVTPRDGAADAGTIVMAGDSVAWSLMPGVDFWNDDHPDRDLQVDSHIAFGCPAGGPGATRIVHEHAGWPECETWHDELDAVLARSSPDLVVVVMGLADLGGRQFDGEWRVPGDRTYDRWELGRLDDLAARLEAAGAPVIWLTFPHVRVRDPEDPTRPWDDIPVNDPARVDRYNALVREAAAGHPGIQVVDLAAWVDTWPNGSFEPDVRDGVHFSFAGSDRVGEWLVPQLLDDLPS